MINHASNIAGVKKIINLIKLKDLNYWNVDLQEAYFSPKEVDQRLKSRKK